MNKTIQKLVERASTGVFFWLVFTVYATFVNLGVDQLETLVVFEFMTIASPVFIKWVNSNLK